MCICLYTYSDIRVRSEVLEKTDIVKVSFYEDLERVFENFSKYHMEMGARGSVVVKALCYKPEGRGFDSR
jgi:hypothetical protein